MGRNPVHPGAAPDAAAEKISSIAVVHIGWGNGHAKRRVKVPPANRRGA
jgi:hypothetical protein